MRYYSDDRPAFARVRREYRQAVREMRTAERATIGWQRMDGFDLNALMSRVMHCGLRAARLRRDWAALRGVPCEHWRTT